VASTTRCARPSPDATVTSTATNAGADTLGGLSTPPARIVNVAGTRTFVAPPAGGNDVVVVGAPAPGGDVRGPVVVAIVVAVVTVVAAELVGRAVVGAAVVGAAGAEAVAALGLVLVEECLELPHPAASATSAAVQKVPRGRRPRLIIGG
jgi:hypothetical protein